MQRHIPIGYRMLDGKIVIHPEKAEVVKNIFKDYINGISLNAIARGLVEAGVPNANNKPSWNHGSVGRILENTKYLGDEVYPKIIEKSIFEATKKERKEKNKSLGREPETYRRKNKSIFIDKLRCGECGEVYREYIYHPGRVTEESSWKCKKHIYKNRVQCRNIFLDEKDIEDLVISAINKIISRKWMLDRKSKEKSLRIPSDILKLEERIKELEDEGNFSSKELESLIFERAKGYYNISRVDDYEHNTRKMKENLMDRDPMNKFDKEIFKNIVKEISIYKSGMIQVKFINKIIIEENFDDIKGEV